MLRSLTNTISIDIIGEIFLDKLFGRDQSNRDRTINHRFENLFDWLLDCLGQELIDSLVVVAEFLLQKGSVLLLDAYVHEYELKVLESFFVHSLEVLWEVVPHQLNRGFLHLILTIWSIGCLSSLTGALLSDWDDGSLAVQETQLDVLRDGHDLAALRSF